MKKVLVKLTDPMGFHARPVALAVNVLREYECEGSVMHAGRTMSMDSVVKLIEMEIPVGSTFYFAVEGKREGEAALAVVDELTEAGFVEAVEE